MLSKSFCQLIHKYIILIVSFQDNVSITAGFVTFTLLLILAIANILVINVNGVEETRIIRSMVKLLLFAISPIVWLLKNEKMKKDALKIIL